MPHTLGKWPLRALIGSMEIVNDPLRATADINALRGAAITRRATIGCTSQIRKRLSSKPGRISVATGRHRQQLPAGRPHAQTWTPRPEVMERQDDRLPSSASGRRENSSGL